MHGWSSPEVMHAERTQPFDDAVMYSCDPMRSLDCVRRRRSTVNPRVSSLMFSASSISCDMPSEKKMRDGAS